MEDGRHRYVCIKSVLLPIFFVSIIAVTLEVHMVNTVAFLVVSFVAVSVFFLSTTLPSARVSFWRSMAGTRL